MKTLADYIPLLRNYMQENALKYGISRMGIFGSVARGEQTDSSDLDIYIEGELRVFLLCQALNKNWKVYWTAL